MLGWADFASSSKLPGTFPRRLEGEREFKRHARRLGSYQFAESGPDYVLNDISIDASKVHMLTGAKHGGDMESLRNQVIAQGGSVERFDQLVALAERGGDHRRLNPSKLGPPTRSIRSSSPAFQPLLLNKRSALRQVGGVALFS